MSCHLIGTAQTLVCGDRSPIALPRREFLRGAAAAVASLAVRGIVPARAESAAAQPDYTLRTTPLSLERAPAPVLRLPEGRPVTFEISNETDIDDIVHWHGLYVPSDKRARKHGLATDQIESSHLNGVPG
jgi:FtsP/CotA-like multicopper oxidase with cupredoxin domain